MKGINRIALGLSRIAEMIHWMSVFFMVIVFVCTIAAGDWFRNILEGLFSGRELVLSTYGFEVVATDSTGRPSMTVILLFSVGAIMSCGLMAMVFHNVYCIMKKAGTESPFQKTNIRRLKEIGMFSIAAPFVGFIMSIIIHLAVGTLANEVSIRPGGIIMGILALALTQIFVYGAELQNDVDGLL